GKHQIGLLYCAEAPVCAENAGLINAAAKAVGLKFHDGGKVSATAPNYTAPCLALKGGGVDVLNTADNSVTQARIAASCAQQGYTPLEVQASPAIGPESLTSPAMNGMLISTGFTPYASDNPLSKPYRDALAQYGNGANPQLSDNQATWSGGMLYEAAA